jgi:peptidylprolyl isomerase
MIAARLAFCVLAVAAANLSTQRRVAAADAQDPIVAQRGDITLTAGQVRDLVRNADPDQRQRLEHDPAELAQFVRNQLLQAVLLEEAKAAKWDERPDIAARAERARQTVIAESYIGSLTQPDAGFPSEAEVQATYDTNKQRFIVPRQFHLAQIFVALPTGASQKTEDDAQKKIADLHQQLAKKSADFADIARKQSEDRNSSPKGGDLGWVREDQLIAPIKTAVAGMQDNAISDPVRSPEGLHIVKLLGTKPAGPAPLADVHDQIVASLKQDRQQQNARTYVSGLFRTSPLQLDEIQLARLFPH